MMLLRASSSRNTTAITVQRFRFYTYISQRLLTIASAVITTDDGGGIIIDHGNEEEEESIAIRRKNPRRRSLHKPKNANCNHHREFLDQAAKQLGIKHYDDWYNISRRQIYALPGGTTLLQNYSGGSLAKALKIAYPEIEWLPWRFTSVRVERGFWDDLANQRRFLDYAAKQLGIAHDDDDNNNNNDHSGWYNIIGDDIKKLGGSSLLHKYNFSLPRALATIYPEIEWLPWKFVSTPTGFWGDLANQRRYLDWVAKQLRIENVPEDWYRIRREQVMELHGETLLKSYYAGSLPRALSTVYAEIEWEPWRFARFLNDDYENDHMSATSTNISDDNNHPGSSASSRGADSPKNLRKWIEYLAKELKIRQLDEWYRVPMSRIREVVAHHAHSGNGSGGGNNVIERHGGLFAVLKRLYPEHDWDEQRFHSARGKKSAQRLVKVALRRLL